MSTKEKIIVEHKIVQRSLQPNNNFPLIFNEQYVIKEVTIKITPDKKESFDPSNWTTNS